jgi:hypothetical protein
MPVRLRYNADSPTGSFQDSPDHGHREAGMINVGVSSHENHVQLVPTASDRFGPSHRQRSRIAQTRIQVVSRACQFAHIGPSRDNRKL